MAWRNDAPWRMGTMLVALTVAAAGAWAAQGGRMIASLDGEWLLATDPQNVGREEGWFAAATAEAKPAKVPWIIQDAFPGYHGVAWYWRDFDAPPNPHPDGRYLLRFWAVDYTAEVWLNDMPIGSHEGGEAPFVLDVTEGVRIGETNRIAVRVLNPTDAPIDGIVLRQTPHRNKVMAYGAGASYNHGGIVDSVELLVVPPVHLTDLFARPDSKTGVIHVQATVHNARSEDAAASVAFAVAPAASGGTLQEVVARQVLAPGESTVEAELRVDEPHIWDLNDPFLYRATARVAADDAAEDFDEVSERCGFREFRFDNGYFRLNGRRIFLRCSHTGNHCPLGLQLPHDPDLLRRDLLNVKVMGFNAIRFIAGVATRRQLDLCDEIGLMVYEESYAGWCMESSSDFARRFDDSVLGMVKRDRNHASIVIWGLLNETGDGPVFRHAAGLLPALRVLDDSRMVMLNSGRWDGQGRPPTEGLEAWQGEDDVDPNVTHNPTEHAISGYGVTWTPNRLAFHPGPRNEYSVVRWTAPASETCEIAAAFASIAERATTDVNVLHNGTPLFDAFINLQGQGPEASWKQHVSVSAGDTLDFVVGSGNGDYGGDSTALNVVISTDSGIVHSAADEFSVSANPSGPWSYGYLPPAAAPEAAAFTPYATSKTVGNEDAVGSLSNPGSMVWEDVLEDQHCYPRVPHTAAIIASLRAYSGGGNPAGMPEGGFTFSGSARPVFLSEYGIGSAVDLVRVARWYEQLGAEPLEDAMFYRAQLDAFMADWQRWNLADTFGRPEDYFVACVAKMADQRLLGLNAIRANPRFVAYSLTGTVDQGMTGEGLTTTFREFKPGTFDALHDGFAPLRWCLFAEPVNLYAGTPVRLDAVLANEDVLAPGEYPVRFCVIGPEGGIVWNREVAVRVPERADDEPAFAQAVLAEDVTVDGPSGKYRFVAAFEHGAAAAGGEAEFYMANRADMPTVEATVTLCGEDHELDAWLAENAIATCPFRIGEAVPHETILVGRALPTADTDAVFDDLVARVKAGATAVFLCSEAFAKDGDPVGRMPVEPKGALRDIHGWLYLKDEWTTRHAIFDGLPAGGLMDYVFYREIIPNRVWSGLEPPEEVVAGAMKASQGYDSGLLTAVYRLGEGRMVLNTLRIRENLGAHPAAERLLRNMLRYAAAQSRD